jgi:hypothetical protein
MSPQEIDHVDYLRPTVKRPPLGIPVRSWIKSLIAALLAAAAIYYMGASWDATHPGEFDKPRYEQIVAEVKSRIKNMKESKGEYVFHLDDIKNPRSLREKDQKTPWMAKGNVMAWVNVTDGTMSVQIVTKEGGYFGASGFYYTDREQTIPTDEEKRKASNEVSDRLYRVMLLDEHWSVVSRSERIR